MENIIPLLKRQHLRSTNDKNIYWPLLNSSPLRAPCCQVSRFPYARPVFERCLLEAVEDLYETPTDLWIPGVAGPKFNLTTGRAEVVIIEYDAKQIFSFSHAEMDDFYNEVEHSHLL